MMRQLNYQARVLEALDVWLEYAKQERDNWYEKAEKLADAGIDGVSPPDFTVEAWNKLKQEGRLPLSYAAIDYSPRQDAIGRPVPNALLKIPTGGGKTYLAAHGVSKILSRYLEQRRGFVLWVVPNEAIYAQTLRHLKDRQHPYREVLDRESGGRTKIMTRNDPLHKRDLDAHLCVMVLMSQSIKRKNKESDLKFFRDRGDVHGFLPPEGDHIAHAELLERYPNLTGYKDEMFSQVKASMGNVLSLVQPIIILDEAHKEMTPLAFETLYGFNPSCVLELSATPKATKEYRPNLLVEVTGRELDDEGMIKLPLVLEPHQENDWRDTLRAGMERLNQLSEKARQYQADSNRYIRPIMLVRVERTGKEQRDGLHVHAEDVRDRLLESGMDEAEVVIKTAEQNDLKNPENQDLLSPENQVRVIITKSALQEGWDCPFAYVLCSLAGSSSQSNMTQLVGRILRQPQAQKTGMEELDQCYVISRTKEERISSPTSRDDIFETIKSALENDGLSGEAIRAHDDSAVSDHGSYKTIRPKRRAKYETRRIFLPEVKFDAPEGLRNIDYETDILAALDWRDFDPTVIADSVPENEPVSDSRRIRIGITDRDVESRTDGFVDENMAFDPVYVTQMISDIVLNPFVGREIVAKVIERLDGRGVDEARLGRLSQKILNTLRDGLQKARDEMAENFFRKKVEENIIQFKLRVDSHNYELLSKPEPSEQVKVADLKSLLKGSGEALEKSLLEPVLARSLNGAEQGIATYLDDCAAVEWWHRNVARRHYGLQGWQRHRIYPDFIFATADGTDPPRLIVLESKGEHLSGNDDSNYKEAFLDHMTESFAWDERPSSSELELVEADGTVVVCKLLSNNRFEESIGGIISGAPDAKRSSL